MEQTGITGIDLVRLSPMAGVCIMSHIYEEREEARMAEERRLEEIRIAQSKNETFNDAIQRISKIVCAYYHFPLDRLPMKSRKRLSVKCRQVTYYFLRKHRGKFTIKQMGQAFGQDHTTVIHSCQTVQDLSDTDPDYRTDIEKIADLINA